MTATKTPPIPDALSHIIPLAGGVFEVRAFNVSETRRKGTKYESTYIHKTVSGYYNDIDKAVADIERLDGKADGIYRTPNIINPDLLSRAYNRMRPIRGGEPTTADHNVQELAYLLVDFDAIRPSGLSSTDVEHQAAIDCAWETFFALQNEGWPDPFVADSGNGAHLMYRVSLEPQDSALLHQCLAALSARFDNPLVHVDQTTFNSARIWKVYGTIVKKGDNTPQRPHRRCEILLIPDLGAPFVMREQLEALARTAPVQEKTVYKSSSYQGQHFDLDGFMAKYGLRVKDPRPYGNGRKWIFHVCPWNTDHRDNSAFLIQFGNGAISAGCHHDGCSGKTWTELRTIYEPDAYQHKDWIPSYRTPRRPGHRSVGGGVVEL